MKKINIAFLIDRPFELRDYQRYGVNPLSKFFCVYVLDCSSLINKFASRHEQKENKKSFNYDECVTIKKFNEVSKFLEKNTITFYIDLLSIGISCTRIRRIMKLNDASRIKLFLGELPELKSSRSFFIRLKIAFLKGRFITRLLKYILFKFFTKKFEPKIDIPIFSGSICKSRYKKEIYNNFVWAHALDYQVYLNVQKSKYIFKNKKKYAVFLDQNAPYHPDYKFHNNKPPVSENVYYRSLNDFFDFFEKKTNIEVIIASHPRNLFINKTIWRNRRLISGKTPFLVKESSLVFAHYSTAISFGVLFKKPIIQLITSEYLESYRNDKFLAFCKSLNIMQINVNKYDEKKLNSKSLESIDLVAYRNYVESFLKSKHSPSGNLWDFIATYINDFTKNKL